MRLARFRLLRTVDDICPISAEIDYGRQGKIGVTDRSACVECLCEWRQHKDKRMLLTRQPVPAQADRSERSGKTCPANFAKPKSTSRVRLQERGQAWMFVGAFLRCRGRARCRSHGCCEVIRRKPSYLERCRRPFAMSSLGTVQECGRRLGRGMIRQGAWRRCTGTFTSACPIPGRRARGPPRAPFPRRSIGGSGSP
jgi:hypothetical protein